MQIALRSHAPSPRAMILSETELSCQGDSPSALRIGSNSPAPRPSPLASGTEPRLRFVEHARAEHAAHLCALAAHLLPDERALILARYADGRTAPQIAALAGCTKQLIQRRLRRLTARLLAPEFAFLTTRLGRLDPTSARVAQACIIQGRSVRAAAKLLHMSQHAVRETRCVLVGLSRVPEEGKRKAQIAKRK